MLIASPLSLGVQLLQSIKASNKGQKSCLGRGQKGGEQPLGYNMIWGKKSSAQNQGGRKGGLEGEAGLLGIVENGDGVQKLKGGGAKMMQDNHIPNKPKAHLERMAYPTAIESMTKKQHQ